MKKNILVLLAVMLAVFLACSCSDDGLPDITPPDLYLDNFNDYNTTNPINYWVANTIADSTIHYQGLITPTAGSKDYAFALTATALIADGMTYSSVSLSTGPTATAVSMNAKAYNYMKFDRLFNGTLFGGTKSMELTLYSWTNFAVYQLGADFSPSSGEVTVNLRSYDTISGGAIDTILEDIIQANIIVYINGAPGDSMDFELVLDNIRFTYE